MLTIFRGCLAVLALTAFGASGAELSSPVRLIVPYSPGGGTDIVARALAAKLSTSMSRPVIVENKPGASTMIGTEAMAKAVPDGSVIGLVTDSLAINPWLDPKPAYDGLHDLTPIVQLVSVPLMLLAHPSVPANNMAELIAYAKAHPGKLSFASLGPGSPHELAMEWLKKLAGIDVVVVPYKGTSPATIATIGGQTSLMFAGSSVGAEQIKVGKLKAIGLSSAKRSPDHPKLGTISEQVPGFVVETWYGIVGPAGMAPALVSRLNKELNAGLKSTELKSLSDQLGFEMVGGTPQQMRDLISSDTQKWRAIVREAGAR